MMIGSNTTVTVMLCFALHCWDFLEPDPTVRTSAYSYLMNFNQASLHTWKIPSVKAEAQSSMKLAKE